MVVPVSWNFSPPPSATGIRGPLTFNRFFAWCEHHQFGQLADIEPFTSVDSPLLDCPFTCRNRNCPKCQGLARAQWLEDRQAELLDVPCFHVAP
jgi:hypothetical protein